MIQTKTFLKHCRKAEPRTFMKKRIALLVFLATILSGCTSILRPLHRLEGTWQRTTKDGFAYESWEIKEPNLMLGKGYQVAGTDTTVLENLRLFVDKGKITYEAPCPTKMVVSPFVFRS